MLSSSSSYFCVEDIKTFLPAVRTFSGKLLLFFRKLSKLVSRLRTSQETRYSTKGSFSFIFLVFLLYKRGASVLYFYCTKGGSFIFLVFLLYKRGASVLYFYCTKGSFSFIFLLYKRELQFYIFTVQKGASVLYFYSTKESFSFIFLLYKRELQFYIFTVQKRASVLYFYCTKGSFSFIFFGIS
jgi:hypothetical protein